MRFASLSTPTYSTPRMAGLQAQASTANVAQAQKAEAFTPSGRIQRQGVTTRKHVEMLIEAIDEHLKNRWLVSQFEWDLPRHKENLRIQRESLQNQLKQPSKKGISRFVEWISGGKKFSCKNGYFAGLDLQGLNLAGIDLGGSDLRWAKLQGAILDLADLSWAELYFSNFQEASLKGANLQEADMMQTTLKDADLEGAFGYVYGLTPERLQNAKNTGLLGDFMKDPGDNNFWYHYYALERIRKWQAQKIK